MLKELRTANDARQKEWDPNNLLTASFKGNELAGEVGEACNIIKKLERERLGIVGSRATIESLGEELADVIICADMIASEYGIDLEEAVKNKFNATSEKNGLSVKIGEDPRLRLIGKVVYHTGYDEYAVVRKLNTLFNNSVFVDFCSGINLNNIPVSIEFLEEVDD